MKKKELLLVEDETAIAESIKSRLETHDEFSVVVVPTGHGAMRIIGAAVPDAVVLDATLPDVTRAEVCRAIRSRDRTANLAVIMLGEVTTGIGPITALELGADDYLTKPFDPEELEARLKAVFRRRHAPYEYSGHDHFRGVHIEANFADVSVTVDGSAVLLTKREFRLLRFFVHNCNQVLNRETLLANVWDSNGRDCRIVDAAIWKLRMKLNQARRQVETVIGFGYRFNEPPKEFVGQPVSGVDFNAGGGR
jgi:DNA-binding response OmpR family regulator